MGSGSTWPQDFLFLVGFLSAEALGVDGASAGVSGTADMALMTRSHSDPSKEWGDMISWGSMVLEGGEKREE